MRGIPSIYTFERPQFSKWRFLYITGSGHHWVLDSAECLCPGLWSFEFPHWLCLRNIWCSYSICPCPCPFSNASFSSSLPHLYREPWAWGSDQSDPFSAPALWFGDMPNSGSQFLQDGKSMFPEGDCYWDSKNTVSSLDETRQHCIVKHGEMFA